MIKIKTMTDGHHFSFRMELLYDKNLFALCLSGVVVINPMLFSFAFVFFFIWLYAQTHSAPLTTM